MFERFTDRAKWALVEAQEECRLLKHDHIGPEHLLLGLLQEAEGVAARTLDALGITVPAARDLLVTNVGLGVSSPTGTPPFTPGSKKVLEQAEREAMQLGHPAIGTEHLLLALVHEHHAAATGLLLAFGADQVAVRNKVLQLISGGRPLPAVDADDVRPVRSPVSPSDLLTAEDIEAVLRDHAIQGSTSTGHDHVDGVAYRWTSFQPFAVPSLWLAVANADVSVEAFDRFTQRARRPDEATPVDGLGDRATFNAAAGALRVLSGSTLFVVRVTGGRERTLDLAVAVAQKALVRLLTRAGT